MGTETRDTGRGAARAVATPAEDPEADGSVGILGPVTSAEDSAARAVVFALATSPDFADMICARLGDKPYLGSRVLTEIYALAYGLHEAGEPINALALVHANTGATKVPAVLAECRDDIGDIRQLEGTVETGISILVERKNDMAGQQLLTNATDWPGKVSAARRILDLDAGTSNDTPPTEELWATAIVLQEQINRGEKRIGIEWPIERLNDHAPLTPGLWLLAGPKKDAKTHLGTAIVDHNASLEHPVHGAIFSLEMRPIDITRRLLARHTGINSARIVRNGKLDDEEMDLLRQDYERIKSGAYPLTIDHCPGVTSRELVARIRRWYYKHTARDGKAVCFVDFLQLIGEETRNETEAQRLKRCGYLLAELGGELGLAIVAAVQFNLQAERAATKAREQKKYDVWACPYDIGMIEGSGALAQSCEGVLIADLVRRRDSRHKTNSDGTEDFQLIVAEQRHGAGNGKIRLRADLRVGTFETDEQFTQDDLGL
jgi:replicative DNA helicase